MKALILAAGVGSRLFGDDRTQPPKALLEFDGKSLLRRHFDVLHANGIEDIEIVVGYRKDRVVAEAERCGPPGRVRSIENPMYRGGPVISLWYARDVLRSGHDILLMDADVLGHADLIGRLVRSRHSNCFLFDHKIADGEDPVRLCLREGVPVDFGKRVVGDFDAVGEWPGFMRMSPPIAALVAKATENHIESGLLDTTYEEALRDVLVGERAGTFGYEDVSDLPWIEIDFPGDLERARSEILPLIEAREEGREAATHDSTSEVIRPSVFRR